MEKLSKFYKYNKINENTYAVFNSLLMDILFVDKLYLEKIKNVEVSEDEKFMLKNSGIYIDDINYDKDILMKLNSYVEKNMKKIDTVYVIVSNACNLKCKYCFIENNSKNNKEVLYMNNSVVDNFLEKYSSYLKDNKIEKARIIFYGGEPLTNFNIIEYLVKKGSLLFPFEYSMVTNGTLLDERKIQLIKDYNINLGLSIDGPKFINDINRIFKDNSTSVYDNIIKKIELLKNEKVKVALSMTISQQFLDNQDKILEWIKKLGLENVNYNLLHFTEANDNLTQYYEDATNFLIKSFEELHKLNIYDDRLNRKIDSFINKRFTFSDCAAIAGTQLTLKPDGSVTVCQGNLKTNDNLLGNIVKDDFDTILNNKEREIWWKELTLLKDECLNCEAIFICGRGCLLQCEQSLGSKLEMDAGFCIHSKMSLKWLLEKLYYLNL